MFATLLKPLYHKEEYDIYVDLGKLRHHWKLFLMRCHEAPSSDQYLTGSAEKYAQWTRSPHHLTQWRETGDTDF